MVQTLTDRLQDAAFIERQTETPLADALRDFKNKRVVPFDVPGHKQGHGNPALTDFFGKQCMAIDVNSMRPLDNLCHPISVIRDAETLAAEAFGGDEAYFLVNGTTSSVQAMIFTACREGDKIIMPRNVHRSAINALILCGAVPVYVNPGIHPTLGIPLGMDAKDVETAIAQNPDAKAVFVNNPTYYGICSDLKRIIKAAHRHGMLVLADEAHGTHLYFRSDLPPAAMHLGADMASVSMHKTGGSLTQSSMLLVNTKRVNPDYVRLIINLTQTTSASYLLMSSLDIARSRLATQGSQMFGKVIALSEYARSEINAIGRYYAFSDEIKGIPAIADFDRTKLSVHTLALGLTGIEIYDFLRDEYDIQIEFGDLANFLAIISVGDTPLAIERLVAALTEIGRRKTGNGAAMIDNEYISPIVKASPKQAFYGETQSVPLQEGKGRICAEFVTCYPPGIPVVAPGEVITNEIINYIGYAKSKGALLTGAQDMDIETINVLR